MRRLKLKYNQWLFKKYGFGCGIFFEKIPLTYKMCPLFSPSVYTMVRGRKVTEWMIEGMSSVKSDDYLRW